ncbi:MAG: ADP-ribosylglycohydrolase family protein [Microscillaceae bacterium]
MNQSNRLYGLGAIAGDVIGSVYEKRAIKSVDFPLFSTRSRFTDDTVLTVATMAALMQTADFTAIYQQFARSHPGRGYGGTFLQWMNLENPLPYNSWGNGSAMRVSPVAWAFDTEEEVLLAAQKSAEVTHNHPEGIKGAQAVALAVFLARKGRDKSIIREQIQGRFGYNLSRSIDEIRPTYLFDVSCQGSVPEALCAFLESEDFETAVRLAISLGGDRGAFQNNVKQYF